MARIIEEEGQPIIGELFRELRSVELQKDPHRFRENLRLIGTALGWEIGKTLEAREEVVTTPLGERTLSRIAKPPVMMLILRAAAPLWEGMSLVLRNSPTAVVAAERVEDGGPADDLGMGVRLTYSGIVDCDQRDWIFVDPMIATGSTILDVHRLLCARGMHPRRFIVAGAIGYRGGVERLEKEIPGVEVFLASCDEELNEQGYIVPGLGDAGDLAFGAKI